MDRKNIFRRRELKKRLGILTKTLRRFTSNTEAF